MLIVDTTVPWTAEWLLNYEIWLATGSWYGGGEWPPPPAGNLTPTSNMARAERRRASRQPRRRGAEMRAQHDHDGPPGA